MHPSTYQALQREDPMPCPSKHNSKPRLAPPVCSRGHVLGRGKRRETRRISTWHAVRFFWVVNTMRVKHVTTKSIIHRTPLRITKSRPSSAWWSQVRVASSVYRGKRYYTALPTQSHAVAVTVTVRYSTKLWNYLTDVVYTVRTFTVR